MSNVRLSNGSPTLERTDAAAARGMVAADRDPHPKPSACRSLFGSVDHDELRRDLKGHLQGMEEAATAKWNFDFANHAPLKAAAVGGLGRFDWEIVDCRDIPDFYSRTQHHHHRGGSGRGSANGGGGGGSVAAGGGKKQQQSVVAAAGNNNVDVNGNHHNNCVVLGGQQGTGGSATERADHGLMECSEQCTGGQRKRPACHESTALSALSAQNKRSHTSSDEVRCPNMTLSSELTPRKSSPKRQT